MIDIDRINEELAAIRGSRREPNASLKPEWIDWTDGIAGEWPDQGRNHEERLIEFRSPLQLKNFTPPPGLVLLGDHHILKGNVFVIGGAPGVGKSRASVALAVAGATQSDWFGFTVHRRLKVLIVQNENGEFRLSREFADLDCEALENFIRICPPPPYGFCFSVKIFANSSPPQSPSSNPTLSSLILGMLSRTSKTRGNI